jgi:cell division protein FtsW
MKSSAPKKTKRFWVDRPLLIATLLLVAVGLLMVFSSSAIMSQERFGSAYLFLRKQIMWDIIGLIVLTICMRMDYHRWQKWTYPLLGIAVLTLAAVLVVGPLIKGARRWIHLGPITFQPSEIAKLALLLWLAYYLDRRKSQLKDFRKGFVPPLIVIGIVCGLILKEPDLGTPMMLGTVSMMMLFLAGAKWKHLGGTLLASTAPLYYELFHVGYRYRRMMAFANPWSDAKGAGYQLTQSIYAFGSGGLFGKGLGASTLKLLYLPDPHTDFIFPIIGEELGFLGALGLILLFAFWGIRGWQAARSFRPAVCLGHYELGATPNGDQHERFLRAFANERLASSLCFFRGIFARDYNGGRGYPFKYFGSRSIGTCARYA